MTAKFVQEGSSVDYTPAADVAAGAVVVQGELVGIAPRAIPANTVGSLAMQGVWDVPKATGAGTAITSGTTLYWDASAGQATSNANSGANKLLGKSVRDAADGDSTVRIRLNQ